MKTSFRLITTVLGLTLAAAAVRPALARDSAHDSSHVSGSSLAAVSVAPASLVLISAYVGSVMVVETVRVIDEVVEVVFKGAANASRAVVRVTASSASAAGIAVGQSVKVVAEGSGHLLIAAGKVLCYVPGEADQNLVHSARSH